MQVGSAVNRTRVVWRAERQTIKRNLQVGSTAKWTHADACAGEQENKRKMQAGRAKWKRAETCPRKQTDGIYKLAVKLNGVALEYVPEDNRTGELCDISMQPNECTLKSASKLI